MTYTHHPSPSRRQPGDPAPADPLEERFLAFGRVFSGVLRQGQRLQVLSPAYSPANPEEHRHEATTGALYLMMGRGLERLQVWTLFILFLIP